MKVKKRNGSIVEFDKDKVVESVRKAFVEVDGELTASARQKSNAIASYIANSETDIIDVEEIQDSVEDLLMASKRKDVARKYIRYRYQRELVRQSNTTDQSIKELIDGNSDYWNTENSNKNARIVTTQRDYLAGITSTDISRRFLLPPDIVKAHDEGIIHFHDIDYFAQKSLHNCFDVNTRFITSDGVKSFADFNNGDTTTVLTHTGEWKNAKVVMYGKQKLYRIVFKRGICKERVVYATSNHRWLLNDGSVTTHLSVGDCLIKTPVIANVDFNEATETEKQLWCKGFAFGDGQYCKQLGGTKVRLCGHKNKYAKIFVEAGYSCTTPPNFANGDQEVHIPKYNKDDIPVMTPSETKYFVYGLLCADGDRPTGMGSTKSNEFKGIQVTGEYKNSCVYDLLNIAGHYVSGYTDVSDETNYGKRGGLTRRYAIQANQSYRNWKVKSIEYAKIDNVWCLEVDDCHSFVLEGGIVTGNCELINLEDMLQNGTVINGVKIEKPHRLITAATIATQIITAVTSSSYGGATINLAHLSPFIRDSYNIYYNKYISRGMSADEATTYANEDVKKEIADAVQTFNYQVNSMTNTNGQAPFLSVFMYINDNPEYESETAMLIEEFLKQRILGFKNEVGHYITPAFPKLLYVLDENNITEDSKYWYLTKLSAECTAKRMVPDYISAKIMRRDKVDSNGNGNVFGCMGCRSFLTPYVDPETNKPKYWGRMNQGVVTINLADIALSSGKDFDKFWKLFDERMELCHRALQCRHERLALATSDVAPILWQYGALARLPKGASIHPLLHGGYSTISLGYAALYECVKYMTGESHSHGHGKEFGLQVMQAINDKCNQWKNAENIAYSPYGSPIESTTFKFAKCLKRRFGIIEGITDKNYVTNSYHINVREKIDPFEKLKIESEYQKLSQGGAISYVECADLTDNIPAVLEVMKFIYDNIMYAELNTKSDYCQVCGYDGEIQIIDTNGTLSWRCPNCGNTDQTKMNVARRTCGYIGSQFWNQGRTQEIKERYVHLDSHDIDE